MLHKEVMSSDVIPVSVSERKDWREWSGLLEDGRENVDGAVCDLVKSRNIRAVIHTMGCRITSEIYFRMQKKTM